MKRAKRNSMTQKVIDLREEGLSKVRIASMLGLSRYQVARIIRRHEKENRYRPINESDPFFYLKDNPMKDNAADSLTEASRHRPDRITVAPVPHPARMPESRPSKDPQEHAAAAIVSPPDQIPESNPYRQSDDDDYKKRFGCLFVFLLIVIGLSLFFIKYGDTINQKIQDLRDFFTEEENMSDAEDAAIYTTHRSR